ncbi:MAG: ABC transporter permease [Clostridium sp.]
MKKYLKGKVSVFFIIAFTFSTFCFLLTVSLMNGKWLYNQKYNSENNKSISFITSENISLESAFNAIKERDLTISAGKFILKMQDEDNEGYEVITTLKSNEYDVNKDIINGRNLTDEEMKGDKHIGVTTIGKDKISLKRVEKENLEIEKVGEISSGVNVIILPQKTFLEYTGDDTLSEENITLYLNGKESEINLAIEDIKKYIKDMDEKNEIKVRNITMSENLLEENFLVTATVLVILITVLNSICISALWVKERKREFVIRKACGAKNKDIFKIFFKELSISTIVAFFIALILYFIVTVITKNMIFGMKVSLSIFTVMITIAVSIITTFIVAVPSMKYISKLQLIEVLREE